MTLRFSAVSRRASGAGSPPRRASTATRFQAGTETRGSFQLAFFFGTFLPFLRAPDSPMAIAFWRLVTVLPLLPLLSVPRFFLCIARLTSFEADLEYFRAMVVTSFDADAERRASEGVPDQDSNQGLDGPDVDGHRASHEQHDAVAYLDLIEALHA